MRKPQIFIKTPLSLAITSLLLGGVPFASVAQEDNNSDDAFLEEITVTANRREENILDVPYNITAVSGETIERSFTVNNAELLRSIPGVHQIDKGPRNSGFNSIRIRGLNVDGAAFGDFAVSSVATVSAYVNETPVYANLALVDLERVEVVRGPQATLYGSGALGGTIKYLLAKPRMEEVEGNLSVSGSSTDGSDGISNTVSGTLNLPIGETLAIRGNVFRRDYAGITDYVNLYDLDQNGVPVQPNGIFDTGFGSTNYHEEEDADTYESTYGRLALKWEPTDNFDALLTFIHQEDESGARFHRTQGVDGNGNAYGDDESGAVILEPSEREFDLVSLEANVDLGFATLTSATSYYDNNGSSETDNTGFYAGFASFYLNYPRPLYTAERTFKDEAIVQELRLVSNTDGNLDYIAGLFYRDQETGSSQLSELVGFEAFADAWFFPGDFVSRDTIFDYQRAEDFKEIAVFSEVTWHLNERLRLTGGLRYFDIESDVETNVDVGAWDSFAGSVSTPFSSSEDDVLFKANLAYDFSDDDLLFVTISEGYRRGSNNGVPTVGRFAENAEWQVYESDNAINYELGIKGTWKEMRYDISMFYVDWSNTQFNSFSPNGTFFAVINAGDVETRGVEFQLSGAVTDQLSYSLGYVYTHAELAEDLVQPTNILTGLRTVSAQDGAELPGSPEHVLNLGFDYSQPLEGIGELLLHLDGYYQTSTNNRLEDGIFQARFPAFSLWNANVSLLMDNWTLGLFAKNLLNEEGVIATFTEGLYGTSSAAEFFGSDAREFITLPRTVGLSVNYNF